MIERAFEPFFTTKATGEGTGLGLATVYGIVSQAGGAHPDLLRAGLGTTFTASCCRPPTAGRRRPSRARSRRATPHGHETVLVVEDEEALREVTAPILAGGGYQVLTAADGAEALAIAATTTATSHLLLTDVVMPGMLGKELAERSSTPAPDGGAVHVGHAQPVLSRAQIPDRDSFSSRSRSRRLPC